jgi:biotin--protein ligase
MSRIIKALSESSPVLETFKDSNDIFQFHSVSESEDVLRETGSLSKSCSERDPSAWQPKYIIVYRDGELPSAQQTPLFDLDSYFNELLTASANNGDTSPWAMGEAPIYGEVVTSTQTMLEK